MKRFHLLLTSLILVQAYICQAQDEPAKNASSAAHNSNPFAKGKWGSTNMYNFGYNYAKVEYNDQKQGHINNVRLSFDPNYFFTDNIALGVDFDAMWSGTHYANTQLSRRWTAYVNLTYGMNLGNNFNLYAQIGAGVGKDKSISKINNNTTSSTDDLFGFRATVGAPFRLNKDGYGYITPFARYDYTTTKFDGGKEKIGGFDFGFKLESYLSCGEMTCDSKHKFEHSRHAYDQGRSFFDFTTMARVGFGNEKTEYTNPSYSSKADNSGSRVNIDWAYYIVNNVALGVDFNFGNQVQKSGSSKFTSTSWSLEPMINLNLPVKSGLNNLFLEGGYGWGGQKDKYSASSVGNTKYDLTTYCAKVGWNDFYTPDLAFTLKVGYEKTTLKDKSSSTANEQSYGGIDIEAGVRLFLLRNRY
jgi:hypothetical protein